MAHISYLCDLKKNGGKSLNHCRPHENQQVSALQDKESSGRTAAFLRLGPKDRKISLITSGDQAVC